MSEEERSLKDKRISTSFVKISSQGDIHCGVRESCEEFRSQGKTKHFNRDDKSYNYLN